jgi:hypothetical protein
MVLLVLSFAGLAQEQPEATSILFSRAAFNGETALGKASSAL